MKKTTSTPVHLQHFHAVAQHLGLTVQAQTAFIKVTGPAANRAMYISNTPLVTRVDLSGFTHSAAIPHHSPPTSRVREELDFNKPQTEVLRDFATIAKAGLINGEGETLVTVRAKGGSKKEVPAPSQAEIDAALAAALGE